MAPTKSSMCLRPWGRINSVGPIPQTSFATPGGSHWRTLAGTSIPAPPVTRIKDHKLPNLVFYQFIHGCMIPLSYSSEDFVSGMPLSDEEEEDGHPYHHGFSKIAHLVPFCVLLGATVCLSNQVTSSVNLKTTLVHGVQRTLSWFQHLLWVKYAQNTLTAISLSHFQHSFRYQLSFFHTSQFLAPWFKPYFTALIRLGSGSHLKASDTLPQPSLSRS